MAEERTEPQVRSAVATDRNVLARAAAILGAFSDTRPLLSLDELSTRSRLPRSTTYRLAGGLVAEGWLEYEASGYRIGMTAFRTGRLAGRRRALRQVALRHIDALASATGLPVTLGVLAQDNVVCVGHRATARLDFAMREGAVLPVEDTALGSILTPTAANTGGAGRRLARAEHRRAAEAWWCHAVAVRNPDGVTVAALSLAAPKPVAADSREVAALELAAGLIGAAHDAVESMAGAGVR